MFMAVCNVANYAVTTKDSMLTSSLLRFACRLGLHPRRDAIATGQSHFTHQRGTSKISTAIRSSFRLLGLIGATLAILPSAIAQPDVEPYVYTGRISFDISRVPFSRRGSNLVFSEITKDNLAELAGKGVPTGVYLRSVHGDQHIVFRVELLDADIPVPFHLEATPYFLRLQSIKGSVEFCIPEPDSVRFRGHGVSLRLIAQEGALAVPNQADHWEVNSQRGMEKYMIWATEGHLNMDAPWTGTSNPHVVANFSANPESLSVEGEIDTYTSVWTPHRNLENFDGSVESVHRDYRHWLKEIPAVSRDFGPGAELAAYINWTSIVNPDGFLDRPAMLMSKNWMANVWSWDHCFNAMALSFNDPELAWQQYLLPFDNQEPKGALPDMINSSSREFNFTKPPIHGWALSWMMQWDPLESTCRHASLSIL